MRPYEKAFRFSEYIPIKKSELRYTPALLLTLYLSTSSLFHPLRVYYIHICTYIPLFFSASPLTSGSLLSDPLSLLLPIYISIRYATYINISLARAYFLQQLLSDAALFSKELKNAVVEHYVVCVCVCVSFIYISIYTHRTLHPFVTKKNGHFSLRLRNITTRYVSLSRQFMGKRRR